MPPSLATSRVDVAEISTSFPAQDRRPHATNTRNLNPGRKPFANRGLRAVLAAAGMTL